MADIRRSLEVVENECSAPIPASSVRTRRGSNIDLSYVDGFYVYSEMNRIFGPFGWSYQVRSLDLVQNEIDARERRAVGYLARVELHVRHAAGTGTMFEDVGFGQGIDRDLGRAHESASKEAVTDAVKRCCRALGNRLGLALYDRTREHVADSAEEVLVSIERACGADEIAAIRPRVAALKGTPGFEEVVSAWKTKSLSLGA